MANRSPRRPFTATAATARRFAALATIVALMGGTRPAAAQDRSPPLSNALSGEARAAYESARLLYKDGDSAGALAKFSRAYDVSHDPRLLWNMAACEKALRHYARATTLITRYLKEGAGKLSAENLASATETQKTLRAFYSIVSLNQAPAGARVLVDGERVGTVPLAEPLALDLGPRVLRVERDGFEPFETKLSVSGNTDLSVNVVSKPLAGRLLVTSAAGDSVLVDDKPVSDQRWEGALAPGRHVVKVTHAGKKPFQTTVDLASGATNTVSVALASDDDQVQSHGAVWPWIAGGVLLVGGAAVGGYFLLRPKEETATPPAGKLGTVVLPGAMRW